MLTPLLFLLSLILIAYLLQRSRTQVSLYVAILIATGLFVAISLVQAVGAQGTTYPHTTSTGMVVVSPSGEDNVRTSHTQGHSFGVEAGEVQYHRRAFTASIYYDGVEQLQAFSCVMSYSKPALSLGEWSAGMGWTLVVNHKSAQEVRIAMARADAVTGPNALAFFTFTPLRLTFEDTGPATITCADPVFNEDTADGKVEASVAIEILPFEEGPWHSPERDSVVYWRDFVPGDPSCNGAPSAHDAAMILQRAAGLTQEGAWDAEREGCGYWWPEEEGN